MDWEAVRFQRALLSNLKATLSSGEADPDDATSWSVDYEAVVPGGYQPDVVIRSDAGSDFVLEMKYYDDPNQDVHFGSIAHLAASTRAVEQSSGKDAEGILVTNADVT